MITYVPTYSGVKYPDYSVLFIILAVLMITMSLQTKLGEKVGVIVERISDLWNGTTNSTKGKNKNGKNGNVKVSQPISGNSNQSSMNQPIYSDGTSIGNLPMNTVSSQNVGTQQLPDYNNMYRQDTTPLVGAATPGAGGQEGFMNEPMAASEFGSYGGFSSW
jgi:hypothetical protein